MREDRLAAGLERARKAAGAPGATAAVVSRGRLLWSAADGLASLERPGKLHTSAMFVLASCSKTATAAIVMTFVAARRLSLETPLARFYPELPNARQITVAQLLGHTSGLAEYTDSSEFLALSEDPLALNEDPGRRWTREQVVALIGEPRFPPGRRYSYCNNGYVVLGGILEQLSGERIEPLFQRLVAAPAGLESTTYAHRGVPASRFAHPYKAGADGRLAERFVPRRGIYSDTWGEVWTDGGLASRGIYSDTWGEVWTDGGLASTAGELALMFDALFAGRLCSRTTLRRMTPPGKGRYGLGVFPRSLRRRVWWGHTGSYRGFGAHAFHDHDRRITLAVLTNGTDPESATQPSARIWRALARTLEVRGHEAAG